MSQGICKEWSAADRAKGEKLTLSILATPWTLLMQREDLTLLLIGGEESDLGDERK